MKLIFNQKGVSATAIILLGLLALSVVLLDGTSIALKKQEANASQRGQTFATSYCGATHEKFPPECLVNRVYNCRGGYLLRSACAGVGDVVLDQAGHFSKWCGYTAIGTTTAANCSQYLLNSDGSDCTKTKNLCLEK